MNNLFIIGLAFVIGGGALTAIHLLHLLGDKKSATRMPYRIAMALVGGICISIGADLIASNIHDTLKS